MNYDNLPRLAKRVQEKMKKLASGHGEYTMIDEKAAAAGGLPSDDLGAKEA